MPNPETPGLPVGSDDLVVPLREWIGEIPCRAVKTVIVKARTFREAQQKLATGEDVEGIDVSYSQIGKGRIICEDHPRQSRHNGAAVPPEGGKESDS